MKHLGKTTSYPTTFDPNLLEAIPRIFGRNELGIEAELPFVGYDFWQAFEMSWLKSNGQPDAGVVSLQYACESKCIVESKSLKLYLQSFHMTRFASAEEVQERITADLKALLKTGMKVMLLPLGKGALQSSLGGQWQLKPWNDQLPEYGVDLDEIEYDCSVYEPDANQLQLQEGEAQQQLFMTESFRSLCPVTGQPDFASILVQAKGPQINPEAMGRYIASFRLHQGFHEQCVEHIFTDILALADFEELSVVGRFTRRGGIDINPVRALNEKSLEQASQFLNRQIRQ